MAALGARLAVGPLALAGFLLPWASGHGLLARAEFSGFELFRFAGRLQQLDLTIAEGAGLWIARAAILLFAVAGAWQVVLAPFHRWHPAYAVSGWYVVAFALAALALGLARSGLLAPPTGLGLVFAAGALFAAAEAGPACVRRVPGPRRRAPEPGARLGAGPETRPWRGPN